MPIGPEEQEVVSDAGGKAVETATAATVESAPRRRRRSTMAPGATVGRYRVVDTLGEGGMGVVYKAHDPELEREVALKLVRVRGAATNRSSGPHARLLREAKALAQLSHPNVIAVHDVGTLGDDVFIAMEFVEGPTLRQWLTEAERSPREILDVLIAAGDGIAAAHRAGLVHRDFKPENVIVGRDGRVRVLDFGLARGLGGEQDGADGDGGGSSGGGSDSGSDGGRTLASGVQRVTLTGHITGTPAYMAPEQHVGGEIDARSDQFAFCLVLFEALFGRRPFAGKTEPQLRQQVEQGLTEPVPSRAGVPARVRRAIARGLSPAPADRFPAMQALLAELRPRSSVRRAILAVIAAAAAGAVAAFALSGADPGAQCRVDDTVLAGVWDAPVKASVRAQFDGTGRAHAARAFERVDAALDSRLAEWKRMRRDACLATRVRGEQSAELLDLRIACLDRRLDETRALTRIFAGEIDGDVVDRAATAALELPSLDRCADAEALRAAYPLPVDTAARDEIATARAELDAARALMIAGAYAKVLEPATAVAEHADRIGWVPLRAEATALLGFAQSHTGDSEKANETLEQAMRLAGEAHDDPLFVGAGLERIYILGYELGRPDDALKLADVLEPFVSRVGDDLWYRAKLLDTVGIVLWSRGDYEGAQAKFEQALPLYEQARGPDDRSIATCHTNLGNALADAGRYAEAKAHYEQELALVLRAQGAEHPDAARAMANMGTVLESMGDLDGARQNLERALAIWERAYGEEHMMIAMAANNLGDLYHKLEQDDRSLPYCQRALAIGEKFLPADHPIHAYHLQCVSHALFGLGRYRDALPFVERALTIREAAGGAPAELAAVRFDLARALWETSQQRDRALGLAAAAREAFAAAGESRKEALAEVDGWLSARRAGRKRAR